ncbi:hypothetical protein BAUCODRAFT_261245 [Baudoinia panamericana UAMH 10762]|uniref:Uncharacterized protein n=1 Tax=Baudoinia panamericana (strain UAMH 10762) TaxID=717646 RepID=M2M8M4_BAUPA|nr:uncharacterized protein BAUCODRAFT_261245 [Baudoinia panamericana UAMH 10762]EMC92746.1 hypothetical protein BAUCODRAFT_261245 [Baudoinia panamericana UAMH 10762]
MLFSANAQRRAAIQQTASTDFDRSRVPWSTSMLSPSSARPICSAFMLGAETMPCLKRNVSGMRGLAWLYTCLLLVCHPAIRKQSCLVTAVEALYTHYSILRQTLGLLSCQQSSQPGPSQRCSNSSICPVPRRARTCKLGERSDLKL